MIVSFTSSTLSIAYLLTPVRLLYNTHFKVSSVPYRLLSVIIIVNIKPILGAAGQTN